MFLRDGNNPVLKNDVSTSNIPFEVIQKRTFNIILIMVSAFTIISLSTNIIQKSWVLFDTVFYSSVALILSISFVLLRFNYFVVSVILFLIFSSTLLFVVSLMGQEIFLTSLSTPILVMISIVVLTSQKLHVIISLLLFIQQIVLFIILDYDYSFAGKSHLAASIDFDATGKSIVYLCFHWFLFIMTFSLKRQIKQSAVNLKLKNKEIQTAYLEMEKFGHVLSHDLKSPIRNMTNFAGLISKKIENNQFERVGEFSTIIQNSGTKAINLIDDVLEFSKLNNKAKQELISSVDLNLVLNEIEKDLSPLYPKSVFKFEQLGQLVGNPSKIKILFQNLIENGLKYNKNPNPIIKIKRQTLNDTDIVSIEDNGIGINEKHYYTIFEPFRRLHDDSTYSGTGIGLASCKSIVEEHLGGKLSLSSRVDRGSIFTINIPSN